ncbi:MAG TPA: biotin-dependent carboxyltransferase family protein [Rhodanobacteraceae bacterium]|nr:biotin-dependent carboxyltransferase family protein [Rhodanobacteraceae bacterium]
MSVEVLKAGLLTTVQDRGRFGCAMLGVGRAGTMDDVAPRIANALVGNGLDAPVLEITLAGPRLRFDAATTIALAGAGFAARVGDRDVDAWRPIDVEAGEEIVIGHAHRGLRTWLAIRGLAVEQMLGSASTDVNARLGGLDGRALRDGDRLRLDAAARSPLRAKHPAAWSVDPRPWFDADPDRPVRLVRGAHFDALDAGSRAQLFEAPFRVTPDSNRVGIRLAGPRLALAAPIELVSEPLAFGTLQLPPDGEPIALMAEHPTVGGYPRIGQIAAVDLPHLAQRRPGETVRFAEIDLETAQTRYLERERALAKLIAAIRERLRDS